MTQDLDVREVCEHLGVDRAMYVKYVMSQYAGATNTKAKDAWLELLLSQIVEWMNENEKERLK